MSKKYTFFKSHRGTKQTKFRVCFSGKEYQLLVPNIKQKVQT